MDKVSGKWQQIPWFDDNSKSAMSFYGRDKATVVQAEGDEIILEEIFDEVEWRSQTRTHTKSMMLAC